PVWTANFDDIPMDTGSATVPSAPVANSPAAVPEPAGWNSPNATGDGATGWADFSSFTPV
ncbi:hypothetical protein M9458_050086, partial [Cirrhinus mrigala]